MILEVRATTSRDANDDVFLFFYFFFKLFYPFYFCTTF
jgi:hypothetical protein